MSVPANQYSFLSTVYLPSTAGRLQQAPSGMMRKEWTHCLRYSRLLARALGSLGGTAPTAFHADSPTGPAGPETGREFRLEMRDMAEAPLGFRSCAVLSAYCPESKQHRTYMRLIRDRYYLKLWIEERDIPLSSLPSLAVSLSSLPFSSSCRIARREGARVDVLPELTLLVLHRQCSAVRACCSESMVFCLME